MTEDLLLGSSALEGFRKVAEDLGNGYVRLLPNEADRRQALQDIRSSEDILIELLRNSRDAGSTRIYVCTHRSEDKRTIVVIDDGDGIPDGLRETIFEPRVTSKLETAHMDRWGMHGRGMALFSIHQNSEVSEVVESFPERGTSIRVVADMRKVGERADQSTFPRFEEVDGVHIMRGPKNLLRTAAEFAIAVDGEIDVYLGSMTEIAATMWANGISSIPASKRIFHSLDGDLPIDELLAMCSDEGSFAETSASIGIPISARSARRIMDGEIGPVASMAERTRHEALPTSQEVPSKEDPIEGGSHADGMRGRSVPSSTKRISEEDLDAFTADVVRALSEIERKYYLQGSDVSVRQRKGRITIECELHDEGPN